MKWLLKVSVGLSVAAAVLPWLPLPLSDATLAFTVAGVWLAGAACFTAVLCWSFWVGRSPID